MLYSINYPSLLAYAMSGLNNAGRICHLGRSYRETTNVQRLTKDPKTEYIRCRPFLKIPSFE
jgi:hypothetical protein